MLFYRENVHKSNYMFCGNMYQGSLYIKICLYKIEKGKIWKSKQGSNTNYFFLPKTKIWLLYNTYFFYMFKSE